MIKRIIDKKGDEPVYFIHFITSKCNAKCDFCFYWKNLNQSENELSFSEIEKLTKSFSSLHLVILTGGEPFLRKDLSDIAIAYYKNAQVKQIAIVTIGFLTKKILSDVDKILKACPDVSLKINLSLNGLYGDMEKITRLKDNFNRLIETYRGLSQLKHKNLSIYTITTYSGLNQDKIEDIYDFVKYNMPNAVFCMNIIRGNPKDITLKNIDIKNYEKITRRMEQDGKINISSIKNLVRNNLIINIFKQNKYITPCYAGSLAGVMFDEGDIFCCELLKQKMGNIRESNYDIKEIWNSRQSDEIRDFIRNIKCFCTHECFYTTNILFNPKFYPKLIIEGIKTL